MKPIVAVMVMLALCCTGCSGDAQVSVASGTLQLKGTASAPEILANKKAVYPVVTGPVVATPSATASQSDHL